MSRTTDTPGNRVDRVMASVPLRTGGFDPDRLPVVSPWSTGDLARILAEDVFGSRQPLNTRSGAMRIPAIARGVNLVKSTICGIPLREQQDGTTLPDAAPWIYSAGGGLSHQLRMAWTVDDLIFSGWSAWWRDWEGDAMSSVSRIPLEDWSIDDDARVMVNGSPENARNVILFPGLHEGLLSYGREALEDTRQLYANVRARLLTPTPQIDLHQTGGAALTDPEIDALIDRWTIARQGRNGGVGYTSENIEVNELGAGDAALMIEARNAAAVDCARLIGVHAGLIDATAPKASLNYETTTGRNQEFVDFDLALYMTPITARLSLDDVTAPGRTITFDTEALTGLNSSPTGPALED